MKWVKVLIKARKKKNNYPLWGKKHTVLLQPFATIEILMLLLVHIEIYAKML